ncbi:hypothetical protein [Leucobacter massiliensis]|uniref:Uncharacterized protein n=1 Tax=Leucobacter massiliensis TaxID=1686285 RepID=A0A2S9QMN5_9MICO|nr:hypothetical protein [Leucobacter massiliensis]PRI10859.1 hypothetical protein B4915_08180 [Leucobacter massiliensis]
MKIRTRIAAAVTAVTAALASIFLAAPAFAHDGEDHTQSMFSTAGDPLDIVAISIVGVVLLAVVLIGSTLIGNLFAKK